VGVELGLKFQRVQKFKVPKSILDHLNDLNRLNVLNDEKR
jgi:hypothetical protein